MWYEFGYVLLFNIKLAFVPVKATFKAKQNNDNNRERKPHKQNKTSLCNVHKIIQCNKTHKTHQSWSKHLWGCRMLETRSKEKG